MPVLVAINGSSYTDAPLHLGLQIAQRLGEPLTVLIVTKPRSAPSGDSSDQRPAWLSEAHRPAAVELRTRVRVGDPATEIVCEAEQGGYDLVIVGEPQTRNPLVRFFLGSTAIRVVEHAPCPVVVAKGKIGPIQRILLCESGSEDPLLGLSSTVHNAKTPGAHTPNGTAMAGPSLLSRFILLPPALLNGTAEIVVLHVMSQMSAGPGVQGKQLRSDAEQLADQRAPEGGLLGRDIVALQRLGLNARAKVCHGLVVEEILGEARDGDYDLVVIGAYRGAGWQRILLDDLAHRIIVELDRPVLVLR